MTARATANFASAGRARACERRNSMRPIFLPLPNACDSIDDNPELLRHGDTGSLHHMSLIACQCLVSRLLPANIVNLFFIRGLSEKCYSFSVGFLFHEEVSPLPGKIF